MQTIYLVTHCEASHSVEGKVGGWFDSELTMRGRKQASELSKRLEEWTDLQSLDVYSSDLKRAVQTAEILIKNTSLRPQLDPRIREMSFGSHEGMSQAEHRHSMNPVSKAGDRLEHRICPGAESRREVAERVAEFVEEVMQNDRNKLIVTHGFAASFLIAAFQKIEVTSQGYLNYDLRPGSIILLEVDDLFANRTVKWIEGE